MPSVGMGNMCNYGLCNYPTPEGPFVFCGHGGAVIGGVSRIGYLSGEGRGYALMLNSGNFKAAMQIEKLI